MILRKKAINALEKNIEINTELTKVLTNKYAIPFARPIVFLENHMEQDNETSGSWNNKGEVLLAQALVALRKAIDLKTIDQTHRTSKIEGDWLDKGFLAGVWSNIGTILDLQHKYNHAINAYDKAIELDPKYVAAWFNKGFALISNGRPDKAIDAFNEAIKLDPKNVNGWFGKGTAFIKIARQSPKEYSREVYDEAIHALNKAIEFDSLYHKAWWEKGLVLFEERRYSEAIGAWDKVIDIKPHDLNAWYIKCLSLYKLGKYNDAIKASNITIKLSTQYALSWFEEYNKLNKMCKYDEAIEAYDWGLELYSKNALGLVIKGDAICNLAIWHPKWFEYALTAYNSAIRLDPFNVAAWCGMCIALNALGYIDATGGAYTRAYRLTLLNEQSYNYIEDFEKPFYWP